MSRREGLDGHGPRSSRSEIGDVVFRLRVVFCGMVQCPRCGDVVDQLQPLPVEALQDGGSDRPPKEDPTDGRACSWCRHELLEK